MKITTRVFEVFNEMSEKEKEFMVVCAVETLLRAWALQAAGLKTLHGASFYIPNDTDALCDILLRALNGSDKHRAELDEMFNNAAIQQLAQRFMAGYSDP